MKTNYRSTLQVMPCLAMMITLFTFVSARAADATDNRGQLSASDYKFAKTAACGGTFEVNLGNMAASNSKNTAVQQFGKQMVEDHGKAGQQLAQIAQSKGATLPTELTAKQQKEVDKLTAMTGTQFDKAYISLMVKCHKMDEKEFKKASEDAQDADLKGFAANTLTVVQGHLKMAEDIDHNLHDLSANQ
jgi:putative membrane protein